MLNRLFGIGSAPTYETTEEPKPEEVPLFKAKGSLYASANTPGQTQKCIYMICEAFVRPTSTQHSFELVVSRGEDEPVDADALIPSDIIFPIDKTAKLQNENVRFGWCDRTGKRYNLDVDDESEADELRSNIAAALFTNIHSKSPTKDDEDELIRLLVKPKLPDTGDLLDIKGQLIQVPAELFKYDVENTTFTPMAPSVFAAITSAVVKEDNSRAYLLLIYDTDSGSRILECEVGNALNAQFYSPTLSLVWVLNLDPDANPNERPDEDVDPDSSMCLSVRFQTPEDFVKLRNQYGVCLYEVNHQASVDDLKLKDVDIGYVQDSIRDDVEPMDIDTESEADVEEENRDISEFEPGRRVAPEDFDDGMRNSQLAVAARNDRTFVVRGNKMGVFSTGDNGAEFKTMVDFKDPRTGRSFNPSSILLHQEDRAMIVLDPDDDTKLMRMDLERGEIVDTWTGQLTANLPVKAVHRVQKYANLTDTQEFVGLNKNSLLRMDPRTNEFIVQSKKYAASTRARLASVSTTGAGYLAVASENGDIRLYDQIGKNAKTHLPGLGDPIIGIDVSEDGNYVLATTAKYLLVLDTRVKGQAKGGFQKSMGKSKPAPRKLVIRNEDVMKYKMGVINFTTAHFNTGSSLERSIVTSTGPFVVIWNFRAVKMGRLDSYKIRRYQDDVVADDFAYDNDGRIVVTLPNNVSVARR